MYKNGTFTMHAQWYGCCKQSNKKVPLDADYVQGNFLEDLIVNDKTHDKKGKKKYIPIPPGETKACLYFPNNLEKGQSMHYKQKANKKHVCCIPLQVLYIT